MYSKGIPRHPLMTVFFPKNKAVAAVIGLDWAIVGTESGAKRPAYA